LFGLGKAIANEYPNLSCSCIDWDGLTSGEELFALWSDFMGERVLACRDGVIYREEIHPLQLDSIPEEPFEIGGQGVYVVTGGTGGIGLEIAKHLASRAKLNLALISRSVLPPVDEWNEIIHRNEDDRLCRTLQQLKGIKDSGSEVICCSADVADAERMDTVLNELRSRFGRIRGVIHSAGVAGQGLLMNKEFAFFQRVLRPKVQGAWVLSRLTEQDDPDMFVLFSSIASFIAYPGQRDYTAANAFVDALPGYAKWQGRKMTTINWPAWAETGMAVNYGSNMDMLFKAISTENGLQAFDRILVKPTERIIIGELDADSDLADKLRINLSDGMRLKMSKARSQLRRDTGRIHDIVLQGSDTGDYTQTELMVGKVWGSVFGLETLHIHDNFYDLGGDSVFAMKLVNSLSKALQVNIGISDIFL